MGDFNLSRTLATGGTSSAPSWIACSQVTNPFWHAPEVLAEGRHSRSSDVYSYGIVLWELLTWRAPWVDDVSSQFQNVFQVRPGGSLGRVACGRMWPHAGSPQCEPQQPGLPSKGQVKPGGGVDVSLRQRPWSLRSIPRAALH